MPSILKEGSLLMLAKTQMQEIQDLKLQGYTKAGIIRYYEAQGVKPPSRPTINKYYDMDALPVNPRSKLEKDKTFDVEPFRSAIIMILEANNGKDIRMSSVYDVLQEKFVERGGYEKLPGNEQTLRNFIHYLENSGAVNREPEHKRIYDYVFDTPPGEQMLIDFGEVTLAKNRKVHFICLLLRYSRYLCIFAQDHKYNALETCQAIYRCFTRLGGRPTQLVIDQDAVFVASETYGEVIPTRTFEDFCAEQDLKLWVCNKADPESKGPIENTVGFVKKNFFSARKIVCIEDVWRSLPGWLERKNRRLHRSTLRVPEVIFKTVEKDHLQPLLPSVYETSPSSFTTCELSKSPYISYKSCKYSVPSNYAYKTVKYKVTGGMLHVYEMDGKPICSHHLSERKGSTNQLPEHRKQEPGDWIDVTERLRSKWNCCDFQSFITGIRKESGRNTGKQLRGLEQFLDSENPDKSLVAQVMKECCEQGCYLFSQFRNSYVLTKAGRNLSSNDCRVWAATGDVAHTDLSVYAKAFIARTESRGATV